MFRVWDVTHAVRCELLQGALCVPCALCAACGVRVRRAVARVCARAPRACGTPGVRRKSSPPPPYRHQLYVLPHASFTKQKTANSRHQNKPACIPRAYFIKLSENIKCLMCHRRRASFIKVWASQSCARAKGMAAAGMPPRPASNPRAPTAGSQRLPCRSGRRPREAGGKAGQHVQLRGR